MDIMIFYFVDILRQATLPGVSSICQTPETPARTPVLFFYSDRLARKTFPSSSIHPSNICSKIERPGYTTLSEKMRTNVRWWGLFLMWWGRAKIPPLEAIWESLVKNLTSDSSVMWGLLVKNLTQLYGYKNKIIFSLGVDKSGL